MKLLVQNMSEQTARYIESKRDEVLHRVLPAEWRVTRDYANCAWFQSRDGLKVCAEVEMHDDEQLWLHVSFSRRDRDPSWFDTRRVKDLFVGRDRKAVQVLPPESEYVNIHSHCLHLYAPLGRDPLPDFRHPEGGI